MDCPISTTIPHPQTEVQAALRQLCSSLRVPVLSGLLSKKEWKKISRKLFCKAVTSDCGAVAIQQRLLILKGYKNTAALHVLQGKMFSNADHLLIS